jgi:hypothetical protein
MKYQFESWCEISKCISCPFHYTKKGFYHYCSIYNHQNKTMIQIKDLDYYKFLKPGWCPLEKLS